MTLSPTCEILGGLDAAACLLTLATIGHSPVWADALNHSAGIGRRSTCLCSIYERTGWSFSSRATVQGVPDKAFQIRNAGSSNPRPLL